MTAIVAAALVTVASFVVHYRQWRRGAVGHFILVAVPAALLFVVLPVPLLSLTTIRGFGRVGAAGGNGAQLAVGLSFDTIRILGVGCLACAVTMVIAGAVQWHATREDAPGPDEPQAARRDAAWAPWLLGACAALTLPAGLLLAIAADVPRLTIRALEMTSSTQPPDPAVLSAFSRDISARLVAGTVAGGALAVLVLAAAGASLVAAGRISRPRRPPRVTWAILGLIVLATIGGAIGLQRDLQWARRVAAAAADRGPLRLP